MAKNIKRDLDLLEAYSHKATFYEKNQKLVIAGIGVGALFVIAIGVWGFLFISNFMARGDVKDLKAQVEQLETDLNTYSTTESVMALNEAQDQLAYLKTIDPQVYGNDQLKKDILTTIDGVTNGSTINSLSYVQQGGTINISLTCSDYKTPPTIVTALKKTGKFTSVTYSGWSVNSGAAVSVSISLVVAQDGGE
ncbi:MAG: hypothetical protein PHI41_02480 [Erysipelotrichaceae bacterium]|nr:hypothetical protein [Erysipelotrichaceae bacterium]MDD3809922.1 hypothetical protein [Erysipelotrichaceae bacterium]